MHSTRKTDYRSRRSDGYQNRRSHTHWSSKSRGNYPYHKRFNDSINAGERFPKDINRSDTFNDSSGNQRYFPPLTQANRIEFDKGVNNAYENVNNCINASIHSQHPEPNAPPANLSTSSNISPYNTSPNSKPQTASTSSMSYDVSSSGQDNINEPNLNEAQLTERVREVKKMTILELIQEVCSEPGADESNIADRFFRALVSTLLSLTDSCPEQKSFIYKILSALVNVGLSYAQNQDDQGPQPSESPKKHNTPTNNSFKHLQSIMEIDLLIQALMQQKVNLYDNIYQTVLSNHQERPASSEGMPPTIDGPAVQKSIQKVKSEIVQTNTSFNEFKTKMLPLPEKRPVKDGDSRINVSSSTESLIHIVNNDELLGQNTFLRLPCRTDASVISNNLDRPSSIQKVNQVCISYGAIQGTEILCFCLYDKAIIAGYQSGALRIFNLESGALLDNVSPHKKAVTSIHVWQDIVITTSLDGTMKLYDLAHHTSKMVIVEQEIFTSCLFKGIFYLGTKSGSIFRLFVKNMKQISNPFCVCMKTVNTIKVIEEKGTVLLFIAAEDASVCIRDGVTGSLIQVFPQLPNATCIVVLGEMTSSLRICAGFKDKMLAVGLQSSLSNTIRKMHSITCMMLHRGILFAASQDNNIFMYDEKTIELLNTPLEVNGEIKSMVIWEKFLIVATSTSGITYLDTPRIVLERWSSLEGSKSKPSFN